MGDRLLSIPQVRELLSVSRSTVYVLMDTGQLPTVKLGRRRMIRESDLQAFIAGLEG